MLANVPGGSKTLLSPTTPEFSDLEYKLQLALHSTTAKITSAFAVQNPHISTNFEKRCKDILVHECWLDSSVLNGANTEEEVIRKGFQFPNAGGQTGLKVPVGTLNRFLSSKMNKNGSPSSSLSATKVIGKFLFCKVGVGRSFVSSDDASANNIPDGYDSLYLQESSDVNGKTNASDYYHEYFIRNPSQILPQYLIQFELDPSKEKKIREVPNCDNCEEEPAQVFCSADKANLCNKCDTKLHETKVASRHVRNPIGKGSEIFGHCRHHSEEWIRYYCSQCHVPVCVVCRMVGNHSNGEAVKHQLVSVADAYNVVLQEAQNVDPILQSRRLEVTNHIAAVNCRAKAVEKMGHQMQAQIEDIYRKATEDLRSLIKKKMDILLGDQFELRRQIGEYDRLEDFVKYQLQGDPTQFLFSWSKQQKLRAELHDFKFFRSDIDVNLDVKVTGGISVSIDHEPSAVLENRIVVESANSSPLKENNSIPLSNNVQRTSSSFGNGPWVPKKLSERRVQRRTSDFFAETLDQFDRFNMDVDELNL